MRLSARDPALFTARPSAPWRISLLHQQGRSWAEVGAFVGQRKLSITADTYTHVLVDGREIDFLDLLAESA